MVDDVGTAAADAYSFGTVLNERPNGDILATKRLQRTPEAIAAGSRPLA
jgi:hypothetical protein